MAAAVSSACWVSAATRAAYWLMRASLARLSACSARIVASLVALAASAVPRSRLSVSIRACWEATPSAYHWAWSQMPRPATPMMAAKIATPAASSRQPAGMRLVSHPISSFPDAVAQPAVPMADVMHRGREGRRIE